MGAAVQEMLKMMVPGMDGAAKTLFQLPENLPAASRGYYRRIESFAHRIRATRDVNEIVAILEQALGETRQFHRSSELQVAEEKVRAAEAQIESLKQELQRTASLMNLDPLTGTVNRRGLEAAYGREGARNDRHGNALCAALLDLDNFKALNDTRGHAAGDAALVHLAAVMRASLRPNDVAARVGGEEFMVLLPDTNEQAAFRAISRLQDALAAQPVDHEGGRFTVSFTASVALRAFGETQATLFERLDQALYRAKQSGKNRVLFAVTE